MAIDFVDGILVVIMVRCIGDNDVILLNKAWAVQQAVI